MGKSTISMVIFNSYVKLPEGINQPWTLRKTKKHESTIEFLQVLGILGHFRQAQTWADFMGVSMGLWTIKYGKNMISPWKIWGFYRRLMGDNDFNLL